MLEAAIQLGITRDDVCTFCSGARVTYGIPQPNIAENVAAPPDWSFTVLLLAYINFVCALLRGHVNYFIRLLRFPCFYANILSTVSRWQMRVFGASRLKPQMFMTHCGACLTRVLAQRYDALSCLSHTGAGAVI